MLDSDRSCSKVHCRLASALPVAACGNLLCFARLQCASCTGMPGSPASIWKVLLPYRCCRSSADMSFVQLSTCRSPQAPQVATDRKQGLDAVQCRCAARGSPGQARTRVELALLVLAPTLQSVAYKNGDDICLVQFRPQALESNSCRLADSSAHLTQGCLHCLPVKGLAS